uniref:Uncharacterized protein n=1 Tax=Tanacetum cinerariifolium TaxID=118510 RepID=A0A6L2LE13_TANCI|nr:hypothetical protein [Tanacetum cinerariifolium]
MGDENPIRTLEDYSKPSHDSYKNTIELLVGNNVYCMEDPEQAFVKYASLRTDEAGVLSARSYPTIDPQRSSHPATSINAIKAHFKEANISQTSLLQTRMGIKTQQPKESKPTLEDEFHDLHLNIPILEVLAHALIYNAILDKYIESLELGKNGSAFIQREDHETPLLVGKGFLATTNTVIDYRIDKIAVGEGITRYLAFRRHFEEIHVTWAHLEKKRTRLRTNNKTLEDLCSQSLETVSTILHDAVTTHLVMASQHFMMASARTDSHENELQQREQSANLSIYITEPSRCFNSFCHDDDDDEESIIPLNEIISQNPPSIITPVLPIKDPEDFLIMRNEELSTILEKESDEFIKSSVEDLVPILSEFEETSGSDSECDLPSCDDFSPIKIPEGISVTFSNPLFDSNDNFTSSDDESLSDEDVLEDNVKIYSNPLFEFDDEYISSDVNPLFDEVLED